MEFFHFTRKICGGKLTPLFVAFFSFLSIFAIAKVYIDIESPEAKRIAIAVQSPIQMSEGSEDSDSVKFYLDTLRNDLDLSGLFAQIDEKAFLEQPSQELMQRENINFTQWSVIGSEALLKTGYWVTGTDMKVLVRLFDVLNGELLLGKTYECPLSSAKYLAHRIANDVIKAFTGTDSFMETKIAFISNAAGKKEMYIMDIDGTNIRRITNHRSAVVSPSWNPGGTQILFTSYLRRNPDLYLYDFINGKMFTVSKREGLNISGVFAPDGKRIALTLSQNGNPEIYIMDIGSGSLTQITHSWGIDVSPAFSPDGKQVAFVSDRSGTPQVFVMNSDGSNVKRLTFEGKYNASPRWSPDGKRIVFSRMAADNINFKIFAMKPDGSESFQITNGPGSDENPSWAPDSRHILFNSTRDGNSELYITSITGKYLRRLTKTPYDETGPAWSPVIEFKISTR